MKVYKVNASNGLNYLSDRFNRFMKDVQKDYFSQNEKTFVPQTNILSFKDKYVVEVELPGVKKENVRILLEEENLIVQGSKTRTPLEDEKVVQTERELGDFKRTFVLGKDIDPQQIKAKFEDGVLFITLFKINETEQTTNTIHID